MNMKKYAVAIGLISFLAMGCEEEHRSRMMYRNREDCIKEWGETKCKSVNTGDRHYRPGYFYGPWFYQSMRSSSGYRASSGGYSRSIGSFSSSRSSSFSGSSSTIRGGFGSTGRSYSSFGG